ncbi:MULTISPECIES: N-acetyltransferase [unclassified Bacillus (in: firmicutes)]|uniref:GNAT family N-acetyltransferase n=1 Tax=unclassified Bacillus (in: firmicutes) TaxID=185979 RepID=UPI0008E3B056|nr:MULTISPECIES: GNAT family N-acetyltransferase [unclassified Bacillus (in: firmicutes)]SFH95110.1 diamine N-acetyltransferase [Bacillus sp. 71mf]SFS95177.1 diamine N-acetyltransferase [Bacillus sp. 103mf]
MSQVNLKRITSENWREALGFSVNIKQEKFVAAVKPPVAIALAKAYIKPDDRMVEPYGIYHQNKMVGFFNLHYTPDSKEDFWLFHFFIDKRFQRKGLGSAAMKVLIKHIKATHPSCYRIRLTVHSENDMGKNFYTGLGFTDDHILTYGESTYSLYI